MLYFIYDDGGMIKYLYNEVNDNNNNNNNDYDDVDKGITNNNECR